VEVSRSHLGGMIMEDLDNQGVLVNINIIILRGTRQEKHMHVQGQKVAQVYLMSSIREGDMGQIACKGN
jgi:hypothetical protein